MVIAEAFWTVTMCQALFKYLTFINSFHLMPTLRPSSPFICRSEKGGEGWSRKLSKIPGSYMVKGGWALNHWAGLSPPPSMRGFWGVSLFWSPTPTERLKAFLCSVLQGCDVPACDAPKDVLSWKHHLQGQPHPPCWPWLSPFGALPQFVIAHVFAYWHVHSPLLICDLQEAGSLLPLTY